MTRYTAIALQLMRNWNSVDFWSGGEGGFLLFLDFLYLLSLLAQRK